MNCGCENIKIYTEEKAIESARTRMKKTGTSGKTWNETYACKVCGRRWEMRYPGAGDICCVEPELIRVD